MTSALSKKDTSKIFAFFGIFLSIIGFILVYAIKRKDQYAMFYAKQGLILGIIGIITSVVIAIFGWVPILGWVLSAILWIGLIILWIMGIVNALSGEERDTIVLSAYTKYIKI